MVFLKQVYREFYFGNVESIEFPRDIQAREFGYIPFGGNMVRHLSFRSRGEAIAEILKQSPSSIYCSNAKYESPTAPIDEKRWLGAELIFDIDATDIPTPCKRGHDIWYCETCFASGKLPGPSKCPKCGGPSTTLHGTCESCISAAKNHVQRVTNFLTEDFGVEYDNLRPYFSGNRGFHIHVQDNRFNTLGQLSRVEVSDFLMGRSLPPNRKMVSEIQIRQGQGNGIAGEGWIRRIAKHVWNKQVGYSGTLEKLVSDAISMQIALIDSSVTTDVHRIFRLGGSLHGNTGLRKMHIKSIDSFDPQIDPIVLSGKPVTLKVNFHPRFRLKGEEFGPFKSQMVELPTYAAVSILTRGLGEVV